MVSRRESRPASLWIAERFLGAALQADIANLGENILGSNAAFPFSQASFPHTTSVISQSYSDSDPEIITGLMSRCRALPRKFSQLPRAGAVISTT
jgi:hypothetical protein